MTTALSPYGSDWKLRCADDEYTTILSHNAYCHSQRRMADGDMTCSPSSELQPAAVQSVRTSR